MAENRDWPTGPACDCRRYRWMFGDPGFWCRIVPFGTEGIIRIPDVCEDCGDRLNQDGTITRADARSS